MSCCNRRDNFIRNDKKELDLAIKQFARTEAQGEAIVFDLNFVLGNIDEHSKSPINFTVLAADVDEFRKLTSQAVIIFVDSVNAVNTLIELVQLTKYDLERCINDGKCENIMIKCSSSKPQIIKNDCRKTTNNTSMSACSPKIVADNINTLLANLSTYLNRIGNSTGYLETLGDYILALGRAVAAGNTVTTQSIVKQIDDLFVIINGNEKLIVEIFDTVYFGLMAFSSSLLFCGFVESCSKMI